MKPDEKLNRLLKAGRDALEFMRAAVQQGVRIKGFDVDSHADVKALKSALEGYGVDITPMAAYECGTGTEDAADEEWLTARGSTR